MFDFIKNIKKTLNKPTDKKKKQTWELADQGFRLLDLIFTSNKNKVTLDSKNVT